MLAAKGSPCEQADETGHSDKAAERNRMLLALQE